MYPTQGVDTMKSKRPIRIITRTLLEGGWVECSRQPSLIPMESGIYSFLHVDIDVMSSTYGKEAVVYVGKSRNLRQRISNHFINREPIYTRPWYRLVDDIDREEIRYIRLWNPVYNLQHRVRGKGALLV